MPIIIEGKTALEASEGAINKKLPVFYNPDMKLQRDINVALINALNEPLTMCDLLAGTGVRGIRLLQECPSITSVHFEDINPQAAALIEENCKRNKISTSI